MSLSAWAATDAWGLSLPEALAAAAVLAAVLGWTAWLRRLPPRPSKKPATSRGPAATARQEQAETNRETEALIRRLEDVSRRAVEQVEEQRLQLEQLLHRAEKRIMHLADMAELRIDSAAESRPAAPARDAPPQPARETAATPTAPSPPDPAASLSEANRAILVLADEGLAPAQISQRTGRPLGEVELVLSVHAGTTIRE